MVVGGFSCTLTLPSDVGMAVTCCTRRSTVRFVGGRLHSLVRFVVESRAELPLPTNFSHFPCFTATGVGGGGVPGAAGLSELEKEVAADVAGLSDVFSDAEAYTSDSMPRPASVREEEDREEDEREGDAGEMHGFFLCFFCFAGREISAGMQRDSACTGCALAAGCCVVQGHVVALSLSCAGG